MSALLQKNYRLPVGSKVLPVAIASKLLDMGERRRSIMGIIGMKLLQLGARTLPETRMVGGTQIKGDIP